MLPLVLINGTLCGVNNVHYDIKLNRHLLYLYVNDKFHSYFKMLNIAHGSIFTQAHYYDMYSLN